MYGVSNNIGGIQTYGPQSPYHMQVPLEHTDAQGAGGKYGGCLNIQGVSNIKGAYKCTGWHMDIWGCMDATLSVEHACL